MKQLSDFRCIRAHHEIGYVAAVANGHVVTRLEVPQGRRAILFDGKCRAIAKREGPFLALPIADRNLSMIKIHRGDLPRKSGGSISRRSDRLIVIARGPNLTDGGLSLAGGAL